MISKEDSIQVDEIKNFAKFHTCYLLYGFEFFHSCHRKHKLNYNWPKIIALVLIVSNTYCIRIYCRGPQRESVMTLLDILQSLKTGMGGKICFINVIDHSHILGY